MKEGIEDKSVFMRIYRLYFLCFLFSFLFHWIVVFQGVDWKEVARADAVLCGTRPRDDGLSRCFTSRVPS